MDNNFNYMPLLFVLVLALLKGCSTIPGASDADAHNSVFTVKGKDFCYPVENDSFDHPIDKLPVPITGHMTIWPRIQSRLALNNISHERVTRQLKRYADHPRYIAKVQQRSARYLYYIVDLLEKYNLPSDLALLPIVESAYEPFAYSHGQAAGIWQFVPITARRFNLQGNWWRDDRRNTIKSTEAAIKYLSYLNRYFKGDWLLTVAAYNAGEGTVSKAIKRNKKRGLPTDFWHLKLPGETTTYVPKLIALSRLFKNPSAYNIQLLAIPNEPYFDTVTLKSQLDLAQAATLINTHIDELYYLNPDINRWATPPVKNYQFKVPAGKKTAFVAALAKLPKNQRINWHRHKIVKGDTLGQLAKKYNSNIKLIRKINELDSNTIVLGKMLIIPTAKGNAINYTYSQSQRLKDKQNKKPRKQLHRYKHKVKSGDSFWRIAKTHHVSIESLARWNNKSPKDRLRIGEQIVIWKPQAKPSTRSETIRKINYRVRAGDSLGKISSKFKVAVNDIVKWNNINPKKYLSLGQSLKLYIDITKTGY